MAEKETKDGPSDKEKDWSLYILRCSDGSLYTGITNDLNRRFKMHSEGKASRYTRTRRPVEILYEEKCGTRTQAMVRECKVKSYPRIKKEELFIQKSRIKRKKKIRAVI
ncbi:MAG: GIY-YIG nuclease family protein [Candidatus Omnitrophica bacterium]|nr:GIY-YIG nuclease family protein [Candidatus Omnitrophota bacterium]